MKKRTPKKTPAHSVRAADAAFLKASGERIREADRPTMRELKQRNDYLERALKDANLRNDHREAALRQFAELLAPYLDILPF
jgi:hypothetical protein